MRSKPLMLSTIVLAVFAVLAGLSLERTNGVIALSCVILPTLLAAARGRAPTLIGMCAVGITAIIIEAIVSGNSANAFPVGLIFFLVGLNGMVGCISYVVRHTSFTRDVNPKQNGPQRDGNFNVTPFLAGSDSAADPWRSPPSRVQFHRLLETIDDIGRLMSMNYEVDTLLPAIVSTAESALNSAHCEVYLWDPVQRTLINPHAGDRNESTWFVPSADSGLGASILAERRLWTRECANDNPTLPATADEQGGLPDAIAPLVAGTELLGILVVNRVQSFSPQFEQLLHALANIYGLGIRNSQLFRRTQELAQRDGLTGLYNHATFQQKLRVLIHMASGQSTALSLMMGDIDHFKRFNDSFGHQTGDEVLRQVSELWRSVLPDSALLARYGGEEFIAALPGIDQFAATRLAEDLRQEIECHGINSKDHQFRVTSSFGVAELSGHNQSADELVHVADQCLYASKNSGRNRVTSCVETMSLPMSANITTSVLSEVIQAGSP